MPLFKNQVPKAEFATQLISKKDCVTGSFTKDGRTTYVPVRSLSVGTVFTRLKLAWMVFTGRADALFWDI